MRKLLWALAILLSPAAARAANYPISAGASTATIQSTFIAAGNDNTGPPTVSFAAGAYSITSQITIPCPKQPMTITGPTQDTTVWPITPTAVLTNSGMVNTAGFGGTPCSVGTTIQFLQYSGANPSSGGGFIYVPAGMNNLTVQYNWAYGVSAQQAASNIADTIIWMDGSDVNGSTRTQNATIRFNRLGTPNSSDCANLMNVIGGPDQANPPYGKCVPATTYTFSDNAGVHHVPGGYNGGGTGNAAVCIYQDSDNEKGAGGYCAGVGVHVKTDNLNVSNNVFAHLEQGMKLFEGCGSNTCPDQFDPTNMLINADDFTQMHRITLEGQQTPKGSPGVVVSNTSQHDQILFGGVSWGLSLPQGAATVVTPTGPTIHSSNLLIENNLKGVDKNGYGASRSYCDEFWGTGSIYNNNLCQGYWGGGTAWGFGNAPWAINNNTYQQATNYFENYTSDEESTGRPPIITGNVETHTIGTITSVAPTISPSSGSAPLTVTLTDPGYTSGSLPQGNTGIWYTTDGSAPVPGTGTAKYLSSGGSFTLTNPGTVKAVGMWGALNQPTSYASGYGFVPSAAVSAAFGGGMFISPTGNDANPGTLASPWLTPNHAMTCGQTITAVSGTYSATNFGAGKWGAVSCPGNNNVAWLQCQTFDTCKISTTATSTDAMRVDASYWGVQGWETSTSTPNQNGGCFTATARTSSATVHHIIFANNVANGCQGGGFTSYNNGSAGVDYLTIVGNIAYNAARGSTQCFSGISIYTPVASDSVAGTHDYVAGNISYDNLEPNPCAGGTPSDGEGVIVDTMDGSQGGPQYTQQVAVENNVVFNNGGMGIEVINNQLQSSPAPVFFRSNTAVGDATDLNQTGGCLGRSDVSIKLTKNTTVTNNLAQTRAGTSCSGGAIYGSFAETVDGSSTASNNWLYSALGHSTFVDNGGSFAYASTTSTNPTLASVTDPGAPSCTGKANAPACAATLVANLKPSASGSSTFGYQTPSNTPITDPLYPAWLCNVTLPSGLVTPGCGASGPAATPTLTPGTESFFNTVSVSLASSTPSATIYYTTNGTTPTTSSPVYSAPITVTATTTIQAIAAAFGFSNSAVGSATYTLAIPAFTSCNQMNTGSVNSVAVAGTMQQFAQCVYAASGETLTCSPNADKYGDVATAWGASNGNITVGAIGNAPGCGAGLNGPGCVTGISAGTANSTLHVGTHGCSDWTWTVTNSPPTLLSATVSLQGGGTAVNTGATVQACANMVYTGSISTQLCGTGTDSFGTVVSNWISSSPVNATMVSTTGVLTGVSAGSTTIAATVGSLTPNPSLAVNVNTPITGVNVQLGGAQQISGAQIQ